MRARNPAREEQEDVLALSFLDVLCCGLGASIALFMVFSVMPHLGTSGRADPGESGGSVGQPSGALFDDADRVLIAPVQIQVRGTVLLTEADLSWDGLPEGRFFTYNVERKDRKVWTAGITIPAGMNPARSRRSLGQLGLKILPDALQRVGRPVTLNVTVCVGGGRQEKELVVPVSPASVPRDGVEVFWIDFLDKNQDWIHVPQSPNPP